ncbi:MAG: hypothetical protein ABGW98_16235 [Myxococcales bacterium]
MSTPTITNEDLRNDALADVVAGFETSQRSPLVAVAMALGIAGTILAAANDSGASWMLFFFCACAVGEEVRNFNVPVR